MKTYQSDIHVFLGGV